MRILLVNDHIRISGGGDVVLKAERDYLLSQGNDVYLLGWGQEDQSDPNNGVFIIKEPSNRFQRYLNKFLSARRMRKVFKSVLTEINPDIIHIHLVSRYPLAIYPELEGYKVIQTLHGPNLFCASSWACVRKNGFSCPLGIGLKCFKSRCVSFPVMLCYSVMSKRLQKGLTNIDIWHCPSRNIYNTAFLHGYSPCVYIPLGVDQLFYQEDISDKKYSSQEVLYVGALSEAKGVLCLYEAFKTVLKHCPQAILKIVGDGVLLDPLKKRVSTDRLDDNVFIIGAVPHEQILMAYKTASVFVMPSIWKEQFGLVGIEALATQTPVVGSCIGGIPEWLHHNEWGFLFCPRDINSMASYIMALLTNPGLAASMGRKGRSFVEKEYSQVLYLERIKNLIYSVVDGKSCEFYY